MLIQVIYTMNGISELRDVCNPDLISLGVFNAVDGNIINIGWCMR